MIEFFVPGIPAPQGSKRHVGHGRMVESSKDLPAWRTAVAWTARNAAARELAIVGPVAVNISFRFPMPASRPAKIRALESHPRSVKPDLDKLVRAIFDALTEAGVIEDDARVWHLTAQKHEVTDHARVGALIAVHALEAA